MNGIGNFNDVINYIEQHLTDEIDIGAVATVNADRIAANMKAFDFTISSEDMEKIEKMPMTGYSGFYPEDAPADAV